MFLRTPGRHVKTLVFSCFQRVYRKAASFVWSDLKSAREIHGFIKQKLNTYSKKFSDQEQFI